MTLLYPLQREGWTHFCWVRTYATLKEENSPNAASHPYTGLHQTYTRMAVSERKATRVGKHSRLTATKLTPIFHSSAAQEA
ncbi:hypothetical protein NDA01_25845 [Trichocoleus desertorum AS-A10]|uniref:hypothetical protein n=1 Tax=Trichocoleus desertorum TaxID=1481672 RepID=UPI0032992433